MAANKGQKPSFIPQKSQRRFVGGGHYNTDLINLFSIFLLILTLLVAGVLYLINYQLAAENNELLEQVSDVDEAITSESLEELQSIDDQVQHGLTLTEGHLQVSKLLPLMEEVSAANVQFDSFRYGGVPQKGSIAELEMQGKAPDFRAVAFQSDILRGELDDDDVDVVSRLHSVEISGLRMGSDASITFTVSAEADFEDFAFFSNNDEDQD